MFEVDERGRGRLRSRRFEFEGLSDRHQPIKASKSITLARAGGRGPTAASDGHQPSRAVRGPTDAEVGHGQLGPAPGI